MRKCGVSADTGSIGQGESAGVMYSETNRKFENRAGADRTAPVCLSSFKF